MSRTTEHKATLSVYSVDIEDTKGGMVVLQREDQVDKDEAAILIVDRVESGVKITEISGLYPASDLAAGGCKVLASEEIKIQMKDGQMNTKPIEEAIAAFDLDFQTAVNDGRGSRN